MDQPDEREADPRELTERAAAGDGTALRELLGRYLPQVRAFVRLRTGPELRAHEACSDIVQSVCREVLEHGDRFQHPSEEAFERWLYTTVLRKVQNRRRFWIAAKREAGRVADAEGEGDPELLASYGSFATPSQHAMASEEVARIEAAFDRMPADYRQVITLAHIAGLSRAEIAAEMGRTEGAVRVLLHRALAKAAEILDE